MDIGGELNVPATGKSLEKADSPISAAAASTDVPVAAAVTITEKQAVVITRALR